MKDDGIGLNDFQIIVSWIENYKKTFRKQMLYEMSIVITQICI